MLKMANKSKCYAKIYPFLLFFAVLLDFCWSAAGSSDCGGSGVMPPTFGSFTGRPAKTLNDCFWDFAQCTHKAPVVCCQDRFDGCCLDIMGQSDSSSNAQLPSTQTTTETTTTTTTTTTTRAYEHADTLIGCVWQFNGCVQTNFRGQSDEEICYERFDECKMIVMGMPMPNSDNSVDELPAPFMNMEPTTASTTTTVATTSDLITMMVTQNREKPSLAQCLWAFFRCQNSTSECNQAWDECMDESMGATNP